MRFSLSSAGSRSFGLRSPLLAWLAVPAVLAFPAIAAAQNAPTGGGTTPAPAPVQQGTIPAPGDTTPAAAGAGGGPINAGPGGDARPATDQNHLSASGQREDQPRHFRFFRIRIKTTFVTETLQLGGYPIDGVMRNIGQNGLASGFIGAEKFQQFLRVDLPAQALANPTCDRPTACPCFTTDGKRQSRRCAPTCLRFTAFAMKWSGIGIRNPHFCEPSL